MMVGAGGEGLCGLVLYNKAGGWTQWTQWTQWTTWTEMQCCIFNADAHIMGAL